MESIVNNIEDKMIDSLSFKLPSGSSYVLDRKTVNYFSTGSNTFKINGTRVLTLKLNGEDGAWLDPSSVRIMYTINNVDPTAGGDRKRLRTMTGPHCMWKRMRVSVAGQLIEDIDSYNRVHEMFESVKSDKTRDNEDIHGFGCRWDDADTMTQAYTVGGKPEIGEMYTQETMPGIKQGERRIVSFKPLAGIFNQEKYLPLKYCPIDVQLELIDDPDEAFIKPGITVAFPANYTAAVAGTSPEVLGTTQEFEINDCRVICDVLTLNSEVNNSYNEVLLKGTPLPIYFQTFVTSQQNVKNLEDINLVVSRAVSRLKAAFITFYKGDASIIGQRSNEFSHPNAFAPDGLYNWNYDLEWSINLGSNRYPIMPCRSIGETFYHLKKTLNFLNPSQDSVSFSFAQYRRDKYIIGMSFEKALNSPYSGVNTKAGQQLVFKAKPNNGTTVPGANLFDDVFVTLLHDCFVEIRETGVALFD